MSEDFNNFYNMFSLIIKYAYKSNSCFLNIHYYNWHSFYHLILLKQSPLNFRVRIDKCYTLEVSNLNHSCVAFFVTSSFLSFSLSFSLLLFSYCLHLMVFNLGKQIHVVLCIMIGECTEWNDIWCNKWQYLSFSCINQFSVLLTCGQHIFICKKSPYSNYLHLNCILIFGM